jgi:Cu2+-exporting ATPase
MNNELEKIKYTCPMHPKVLQDKPGMCPECGMNLVPLKLKQKEPNYETHKGMVLKNQKYNLRCC